MPITPWTSVIARIANQEDVSAETLSPIFNAYTNRTQYLYEKFNELTNKSVLIAFDQLVTDPAVAQYSVVYFDPVQNGLKLAVVGVDLDNLDTTFRPANSTFIVGIVKDPVPVSGTKNVGVWLEGLIESTDDLLTALLDNNEQNIGVNSGPLFLSNIQAGKLTFAPGGIAVYIGYAKSRNAIFLNPSFDAVNGFFFDYRFTILDRPAGTPVLSSSTWTIPSYDLNRVGWIPASANVNQPGSDSPIYAQGSLFFYNLPADSVISNDGGLNIYEKAVAKSLAKSLPPNPTGFSNLTVNGVIQLLREADINDGIYYIDNTGIWWYSNQDGQQPWASDLVTSLRFKSSTSDNSLSIIDAANSVTYPCPYQVNQAIKLFAAPSNTLPSGLSSATTYYVNTILSGGVKFTITATQGSGMPVTITSDASASGNLAYVQWLPDAWTIGRGSANLRPRMDLMFVRVNPDYQSSLVTSIAPYDNSDNNSTKAIQFVDAADGLSPEKTGNLLLKYKLPIATPVSETIITGQAVKSVSYDEPNGQLIYKVSPVITSIVGAGGVKAILNANTGACVITASPSSVPTLVSSIEPVNSTLELTGLHSYLTFFYNKLPCGFIGKILLPSPVLNLPLNLSFIILGKNAVTGGGVNVALDFAYSVMVPGTLITNTNTGTAAYTHVFDSAYLPFTNMIITPPQFSISADQLVANGVVNFKLSRSPTTDPNAYTGAFSVVGVYWTIG